MIYGVLAGVAILIIFLFYQGEGGLKLKPSTKVLLKWEETDKLCSLRAVHRYIYCRWTTQYIKYLAPIMVGLRGKKWLSNTYHSKVLTTQSAKEIITLNKDIPLQDLEQVIPYPVARKIVLNNPLDIVVIECPCRQRKSEPCTPTQVCMVIGKPFTDFMLEHQPKTSMRISSRDALALLDIAHNKGWVHTAWFKDVCLERFYVICNCCKCCCAGISSMVNYGIEMVQSSGYLAKIDKDKCVKCGVCKKSCPFEAISADYTIIDDKCLGCGVCATKCAKDAMTMEREISKGIPLEVNRL